MKNTFVKCRFLVVFGNTITFLRAQAQANPHLLNVKFTFVFFWENILGGGGPWVGRV